MECAYSLYPFSMIFIYIIIILFIFLLYFSNTRIIYIAGLIFLYYTECINLKPIIESIEYLISTIYKSQLELIYKNLKESLPVKGNLTNKKQAIYMFNPHGILSLMQAMHIGSNVTDWPDRNVKGTLHYIIYESPIIKDFVKDRFVSSYYNNMKEVLLNKQSLSINLGGIQESKYIDDNKITVCVNSRVGIFKMSLETGVSLIPVLSYGENRLIKRLFNDISNSYKYYCVPIPTITSLLEWSNIYTKPLKNPIITYIGDPIEVELIPKPTKRDIDKLKARYIAALHLLYKNTRPSDYDEKLYVI